MDSYLLRLQRKEYINNQMEKWTRGTRRRQQDKRSNQFQEMLSIYLQRKWKRNSLTWNYTLSPFLCSHIFLLLSSLPVEDSDHNCQIHVLWSLCLSAPDVSCVTEIHCFPLQTQREALSPAGIVSSGKCRLKEPRRRFDCVCVFFSSQSNWFSHLWLTQDTVKCRGSIYRNINYFPLRADISI